MHIIAAIAEHEREMISARTKAALVAAKARGARLGNPRWQESIGKTTAACRKQLWARNNETDSETGRYTRPNMKALPYAGGGGGKRKKAALGQTHGHLSPTYHKRSVCSALR